MVTSVRFSEARLEHVSAAAVPAPPRRLAEAKPDSKNRDRRGFTAFLLGF
jgi:hypothetical protein